MSQARVLPAKTSLFMLVWSCQAPDGIMGSPTQRRIETRDLRFVDIPDDTLKIMLFEDNEQTFITDWGAKVHAHESSVNHSPMLYVGELIESGCAAFDSAAAKFTGLDKVRVKSENGCFLIDAKGSLWIINLGIDRKHVFPTVEALKKSGRW